VLYNLFGVVCNVWCFDVEKSRRESKSHLLPEKMLIWDDYLVRIELESHLLPEKMLIWDDYLVIRELESHLYLRKC